MSHYGNSHNPFMTEEVQHASDKVLQECAEINAQFDKLLIDGPPRKVTRMADAHSNGHSQRQDQSAASNPYLDPALKQSQHEFAPEANAEFVAKHNHKRKKAADSQRAHKRKAHVENPYHRHNYYKTDPDQEQNEYGLTQHGHGHADDDGDEEHEEELEAFISKFETECNGPRPPRDEKVASDGDVSPRRSMEPSDDDRECIEGCESITPGNFGSMRAGDVVSMLFETLWTYYRVVRLEENGGALVAEFESGFASADPEESVYIKHGAISRFLTVWAEQTAAPAEYTICRERKDVQRAKERVIKPAVNGWVKLEHDGKLYLVLSYTESTGMATLKGIGQSDEQRVNLDVCAHKVL